MLDLLEWMLETDLLALIAFYIAIATIWIVEWRRTEGFTK